jgi:hypothetical protein
MVIGVAQAGRRHFDEQFPLARAVEIHLDDLPLSRISMYDPCLGFHLDYSNLVGFGFVRVSFAVPDFTRRFQLPCLRGFLPGPNRVREVFRRLAR